MTQEAARSVVPLLGLFFNACCFVVGYRFVVRRGLLKALVLGFAAGAAVLFAAGGSIEDFFVYAMLSYGYFHFVNLGESARRVRLLREMEAAGAGLTAGEVFKRYNAREILDRRLERLLGSGQVKERDGRLFISNPVMLLSARIIRSLKGLLLGSDS